MNRLIQELEVKTKQKNYNIIISNGVLKDIGMLLKERSINKKILIITDENVDNYYGKSVEDQIKRYNDNVYRHVIKPGEMSKSMDQANKLYSVALSCKLDRSSFILALGGGVVGDLAGFIAATYMRGIGFIQVPTTLLAQVDSSVGGKVAVNHPEAKNIIGAFYQPDLVIADSDTLDTLPQRELVTGLAEVIKHAIIADYDFFQWLENNLSSLLDLDKKAVNYAVVKNCKIKSEVVSMDENEKSIRAILNFGHTIGHAIESISHYNTYTHGEAIAIGMHYAMKLALSRQLIERNYYDRVIQLITKAGLPLAINNLNIQELIDHVKKDKKAIDDKMVFILPTHYGKAEQFNDVTEQEIYHTLSN